MELGQGIGVNGYRFKWFASGAPLEFLWAGGLPMFNFWFMPG